MSHIDLVAPAIGLLLTLLLGLAVKPLVNGAKESMKLPPPTDWLAGRWKELTDHNEGGAVLGFLERALFFLAFSLKADAVVAGWLAFKVASKWNAWTNIIAVPKEIPGIDPIEFLIARRYWGSHLLMTFLVGTLANVLAGFIGAAIARHGAVIAKAIFG